MAAVITESIQGDDISISTTATLLYTASATASRSEPEKIVFQNTHASQTLTIGGSDVAAASNGVVLANQYDSVTLHLTNPGETVYGAGSAASTTGTVTRIG